MLQHQNHADEPESLLLPPLPQDINEHVATAGTFKDFQAVINAGSDKLHLARGRSNVGRLTWPGEYTSLGRDTQSFALPARGALRWRIAAIIHKRLKG